MTDLQRNVELQGNIELEFRITKFETYAAVLLDIPYIDSVVWLESLFSKHQWEEVLKIFFQAVSELTTVKEAIQNKRSNLQVKKVRLIERA